MLLRYLRPLFSRPSGRHQAALGVSSPRPNFRCGTSEKNHFSLGTPSQFTCCSAEAQASATTLCSMLSNSARTGISTASTYCQQQTKLVAAARASFPFLSPGDGRSFHVTCSLSQKKKKRKKKNHGSGHAEGDSGDDNQTQGKSYTIVVPRNGVKFTFSRSSGPGGQNVNKVSTRATLRFDLDSAGWLPPEVRDRIREQEPSRINKSGEFALSSDVHRTQPRNIDDCMHRLQDIVDAASVAPKIRRMRTGLGDETKRRRRESKRRRSEVKAGRSKNFSKDMF